jgi:hypothetical protein
VVVGGLQDDELVLEGDDFGMPTILSDEAADESPNLVLRQTHVGLDASSGQPSKTQ